MKITRKWVMSNKRTFGIKPIKELLLRIIPQGSIVLDPFPFEYKRDVTDLLNETRNESYEYAVFDPPYSPRQLKECYKGKGEYHQGRLGDLDYHKNEKGILYFKNIPIKDIKLLKTYKLKNAFK